MDNDLKGWLKFWAALALIAGVSANVFNLADNYWRLESSRYVAEMVKNGATPFAAQCAVYNNTHDGSCVAALLK